MSPAASSSPLNSLTKGPGGTLAAARGRHQEVPFAPIAVPSMQSHGSMSPSRADSGMGTSGMDVVLDCQGCT
eukprot:CAMPEP_0172913394 /NCGR_PEP_ID=MMETSP1075-20121228/190283_1 /TAXON_ID=2916 /ORGANISM="Ceratium fusus, Strain PA161109" /LENGTH=71 /DNA_ID=CAMNT_0013772097 /DNA_START=219 /DNA_END=435 /DNA_ORIENTATION=-